ncbi:MAG: type II toxin-antitoxin system HicB family antitoxin [Pseudonocardiaceae bacterium]
MSTYAIIIECGATGSCSAWSPDLPGCVAEDQDECLVLMREAIEFHLEGLREGGQPIPYSGIVAATVFTTAA